jgi:hypothetical protein
MRRVRGCREKIGGQLCGWQSCRDEAYAGSRCVITWPHDPIDDDRRAHSGARHTKPLPTMQHDEQHVDIVNVPPLPHGAAGWVMGGRSTGDPVKVEDGGGVLGVARWHAAPKRRMTNQRLSCRHRRHGETSVRRCPRPPAKHRGRAGLAAWQSPALLIAAPGIGVRHSVRRRQLGTGVAATTASARVRVMPATALGRRDYPSCIT